MAQARTVLVVGSNGMLGGACVRNFQNTAPHWRVATTARDGRADFSFEVESGERALVGILNEVQPDYVINCVAVLAADINEEPHRVASAVLVNSWFPHALAAATAGTNSRLIHVSTDGVFSGAGTTKLSEASPPDATDFYGLSKRLGESDAPHALTVRCSVVGRDARRRGITEWYLAADPNIPVRGFTDYRFTPSTVTQVAAYFQQIVETSTFDDLRQQGPILHYAPNRALTKFEYLTLLRSNAGGGAPVEAAPGPAGPMCRELTSMRGTPFPLYSPTDWNAVITELLENE